MVKFGIITVALVTLLVSVNGSNHTTTLTTKESATATTKSITSTKSKSNIIPTLLNKNNTTSHISDINTDNIVSDQENGNVTIVDGSYKTYTYNGTTVTESNGMKHLVINGTDYNSGTIPKTNITIIGLTDPKTGKPMNFDDFLDNFVPGYGDKNIEGNKDTIKRRNKKRGPFDDDVFVRRWCVPQVSVNPTANPYHEALTGRTDANLIRGAGRPMLFPNAGVDCPSTAAGPCTLAISREITYQNAIAYSVSDSQSNTVTKNVGGGSSQTNSSSVSDTISHTLEKSWSNSDTHTSEESVAHTTGDVITSGWSKSTGDTTIVNIGGENSKTKTETSESSENWNVHGEVSANAWVSGIFAGGGITATGGGGYGKAWGGSKGTSTTDSTNWSIGSQHQTNREDNFSKQTQDLTTETRGTSDSHTSTTGGSESDTNSRMTTKGVEVSVSSDWSLAKGTENGSGTSNTSTSTNVLTTGFTYTYPIAPGDCYKAACFPNSEMFILPFVCADVDTQTAERTFASVAKLEQTNKEIGCFAIGLITCDEASTDNLPFVTYDRIIRGITDKNSLKVGRVLDSSSGLVSNNGQYTAVVENNGNFIIWKGTVKVWESGATPFVFISGVNNYKHRVRINARGHLVIESANIWSKVKPAYKPNTFVETWSTQNIFNNVTVGSPRTGESAADEYVLVLDDNGRLALYDAAYVKLWCTFENALTKCANSKGFKYQEEYLVPTDFPTPDPGLGGDKDPHNTILDNPTLLTNKSSIVSQDVSCTDSLKSGNGLVSPNGRFKVILDTSGNLLIKDGTRTMWNAYTADFDNSVGPYKLTLTNEGDLAIIDNSQRWIWYAKNTVNRLSGPYKASITDEGKFVVTDATNVEMWNSWPNNNINNAMRLYDKFVICYKGCNECRDTSQTLTFTHTTTTTLATKTITSLYANLPTATATSIPAPTVENVQDINKICTDLQTRAKSIPYGTMGTMESPMSGFADGYSKYMWYNCDCLLFGGGRISGFINSTSPDSSWGGVTDKTLRKRYLDDKCSCYNNGLFYEIVPVPKDYGSLEFLHPGYGKEHWDSNKCDATFNKEPFIINPINDKPVSLTTFIDFKYYDKTNYGTSTTSNVVVSTGTSKQQIGNTIFTYHTVDTITSVTIAPTATVSPSAFAPTAIVTRVRPTPPSITWSPSKTTTSIPTATGTCSGGKPGKGDGSGTKGQCCKVSNDCKDTCIKGTCN